MQVSFLCFHPKTGGRRIVSLDGMFGLKRWKKSGESYSPPRYNETFFINQSEVDTFLKGYKQAKNTEQNCSSFQAGSLIHTDKTSGQIDETGLFGAVCRHEMPLFFFNLKQGEQIGNAVYLIRHLIAESPTTKHYVLYDIACMLAAHLKKTGQTELLSKIALAVPAFHIYGHKPSCQMIYSTRRVEGFALSDGEQVERLWSFLRNFSRSTKEMSASNRIDAITEALLHYSKKKIKTMGNIILQRSKRAEESLKTSKKELADALSNQTHALSPITEDDIKQWITEKSTPSSVQALATGHNLTPQETYAIHLRTYYNLCDEIEKDTRTNSHHMQILLRKVSSMNEQLKLMESGTRWGRTDSVYLDSLRRTEDRKRVSNLNQIHTMAVERWFLLLMKQKYAGCSTVRDEVAMLKAEMLQLHDSLNSKWQHINETLKKDSLSAGERSILGLQLSKAHHDLYMVCSLFKDKVAIPPMDEPTIVPSVSWVRNCEVSEEMDMPIINAEDDDDTALDELIEAIEDDTLSDDELSSL
ncbi:hypothetical protein BSL78_20461 [Apostichopus japonicus]|uniref:Uncharacterized protein n=1 Tax=Stichopus japonicus TaxID=307972 RepID=A0A2G8K3W9_STIJA|nr:hypothetical protein BSL78_20461 [Apostichopus japonicus]